MHTQDHQVHTLSDEINRLAVFEGECQRKDKVIASLREEVCGLQRTLRTNGLKCAKNI